MSEPHSHVHSTSAPHSAAAPGSRRRHGRGDFDLGFSFLRSSLAVRVAVVAACAAVLWAAVAVVIA